jgi:hypothetical protein
VLDLNHAVGASLGMLRRLIGEDIELVWAPGADAGRVRIDPYQVDQLLTNLAANARDAIAGVGRLTIRTHRQSLGGAECARRGLVAGAYSIVDVSDDGRGMDADTAAHLFEPFFTTKPVGQGTGLGLATVYGIVKQNGGCVEVETELGRAPRCASFCRASRRRDGSDDGHAGAPRNPGTRRCCSSKTKSAVLRSARSCSSASATGAHRGDAERSHPLFETHTGRAPARDRRRDARDERPRACGPAARARPD